VGAGGGGMCPQLNLNDIGRNCLLGNRKKIAKFLMRTFTYRSPFLYVCTLCLSTSRGGGGGGSLFVVMDFLLNAHN
jgi:hypothetical protein